jgi:hypothetical protein
MLLAEQADAFITRSTNIAFDLNGAKELASGMVEFDSSMNENRFGRIRCCVFGIRQLDYLRPIYTGTPPRYSAQYCISSAYRLFRGTKFLVDIAFYDYLVLSNSAVVSEFNFIDNLEFGLDRGKLVQIIVDEHCGD